MPRRFAGHELSGRIFPVICALLISVLSAGGLFAAEFCVSNAAQLASDLSTAESNGEDDIFKMVQGAYLGNFEYVSGEGKSLAFQGGYHAGCASRDLDPANTIFNGQNAGRVLYFYHTEGGSISVEGVTIQNGSGTWGAGIYIRDDKSTGDVGNISLTRNIITANSTGTGSGYDGGGVNIYSRADSGVSGNVALVDNIISGNTADRNGGGVYLYTFSYPSGNSGEITFTNNIITNNTATTYDGGGVQAHCSVDQDFYTCGDVNFCNNSLTGNTAGRYGGGLSLADENGTVRIYNNIVWGNTAGNNGDDLHLYSGVAGGTPSWSGFHNDYAEKYGAAWTYSGNNIDQDPLFANPARGNYRLSSRSACRNAGIYGRKDYINVGGQWQWLYYDYSFIPDYDFEDDSRDSEWVEETANHFYKYCDMGADEFTVRSIPLMPLLLGE